MSRAFSFFLFGIPPPNIFSARRCWRPQLLKMSKRKPELSENKEEKKKRSAKPDLPDWMEPLEEDGKYIKPLKTWLIRICQDLPPGNIKAFNKVTNPNHRRIFLVLANLVRYKLDEPGIDYPDKRFESDALNLVLFILQFVTSITVPEERVDVTNMCWLSTASCSGSGNRKRPRAQYKYKVLEDRNDHQGLRLKAHKGGKGVNVILHRFTFLLVFTQSSDSLASHRCYHLPQQCISPFCQCPEDDKENRSREACINGCANYCPHKYKCLYRSHKTGLERPCRSDPDKALSKQDCTCHESCWDDDNVGSEEQEEGEEEEQEE